MQRTKNILMLLLLGVLLPPCRETKKKDALEQTTQQENWNFDSLKHRASQNLDSAQWDMELYHQDLENYQKFKEIFQSFPLNKSPFPVAEYDYAVASTPFMIELDTLIFKGVSLGEHENPESEKIIYKLSLIVLTNDKNTQENTLVESRNYPYLTAQGTFEVEKNSLDWVFTASTDGYSTLLVNMKLFDLRFGETIIIYPQKDESFLYDQVKDSPNNYENFEEFKKAVLNHLKVRKL